MAITSTSLDYTDKDFAALKSRLEKLAKSAFPNWTDFTTAGFGNFNIELMSHIGDIFSFYQDAQAAETRWSTAQRRRNILALCKLIGYKPKNAKASRVTVTLTLNDIPAADVVFASGTVVRTGGTNASIPFELIQDYTIGANADPPSIEAVAAHWESVTETFPTTGKANQEITLGRRPFIEEEYLEVTDAQGSYTLVDSLLGSGSTDKHVTVLVDHNERAVLRFGDGVNGAIPVGSITVSYKIGGGELGNVEPNTITNIDGTFVDALNNPVIVSVTNAEKAKDGADAETVAQIRENAPASLRVVGERTVSREDFEIRAMAIAGVARALMMTSNEDVGIPENSGRLYIIPVGGGSPTQDLKDAVLTQVTVTYPCTLTFNVGVYDPVYTVVNIFARVYLRAGYSNATVKANITAALTSWFALNNPDGSKNTNVDFGFYVKDANGDPANEIPLDEMQSVVRSATGVRKLGDVSSDFLVNSKHADLTIAANAFPVLGTITLINGDTGVVM